MTEYHDFLKIGMQRVDEMSEAMKEKVEKLVQEKAEVKFLTNSFFENFSIC